MVRLAAGGATRPYMGHIMGLDHELALPVLLRRSREREHGEFLEVSDVGRGERVWARFVVSAAGVERPEIL